MAEAKETTTTESVTVNAEEEKFYEDPDEELDSFFPADNLFEIENFDKSGDPDKLSHSQKKEKRRQEFIGRRKEKNKQVRKEKRKNFGEKLRGMDEAERNAVVAGHKAKLALQAKNFEEASQNGVPLIFDLSFETYMKDREVKSLASQINLSVSAIRKSENPPFAVYLTSLKEPLISYTKEQGLDKWPLHRHEEAFWDVEGLDHSKMIYLSPDATEELDEVEKDSIFIIGGIVDRSPVRNLSYSQARRQEIRSARLPLEAYLPKRLFKALNINTVVEILLKYHETTSWEQAFEICLPKRIHGDVGKHAQRLAAKKVRKEEYARKAQEEEEAKIQETNKEKDASPEGSSNSTE